MKPQITFILVFLYLLTACGGNSPETAVVSDAVSDIQILIAGEDFPTGTPRIPFLLYSGSDPVADAQSIAITLFDLAADPPTPGWQGTATSYSDYEVPYWVVYPDIPQPGFWGLQATVRLADGSETVSQFTIEAKASPNAPLVGTAVPASQNRTLATEPDISKLTTDYDEPISELYQMTIAEAIQTGKPTVVTFATPAFCQTAICAPVLSSVKQVFADYAEVANFIHVEVYKEVNPDLVLDDTMVEWQLQSEPWTFVLDADGIVAARLVGPVSPRELTAALTPLLP